MATGYIKFSRRTPFLRSVFEKFKAMQKSKEFCDVTIVVKGTKLPAHRMILLAASEKFQTYFNDPESEQTGQQNEIENFEPETMSVIMEYIYSGQMNLNDGNIAEVLRLCDHLELERARQTCHNYILTHGNVKNCIQSYLIGKAHGNPEIIKFAEILILSNLKEANERGLFLNLSINQLPKILSSTMRKSCAGQMYTIIIRWVKHDLTNRKQYLRNLLEILPMDDLPVQFFVFRMENESLLRDDIDCANWLTDRLNQKCNSILQNTEFLNNTAFIMNRMGNDLSAYKLNIDSQTFQNLAPRPNISLFTTAYFQNSIYIAGGQNNDDVKPSNLSYKYDRQENTWTNIDFKYPKIKAGSAVLNDRWYIIGGHNGNYESVVYDFYSEKSSNLPRLKFGRTFPGVTTYNGSLFVCCGYGWKDLDFIDRYDPRQGEWSQAYTFEKLNGACSAAVIGHYLYCLRFYTSTLERVDLRSYESEILPALTMGDYTAAVGSKLVVAHKEGVMEYVKDEWQPISLMSLNEPIIISCE